MHTLHACFCVVQYIRSKRYIIMHTLHAYDCVVQQIISNKINYNTHIACMCVWCTINKIKKCRVWKNLEAQTTCLSANQNWSKILLTGKLFPPNCRPDERNWSAGKWREILLNIWREIKWFWVTWREVNWFWREIKWFWVAWREVVRYLWQSPANCRVPKRPAEFLGHGVHLIEICRNET
jgi:hypothetical protein